jgi:gliding-associated putative ABC transporter substrate-binding component GldG
MSKRFFFRLDLTEDKEFTLSNATKDIIKNLEEPITISAYFSEDMPQQMKKTRDDFKDMLYEYATLSNGMIDFEFIDPHSKEIQQEAMQNGIQPLTVQVREKDQAKQQTVFSGAVLNAGEQKEILPVLVSGSGMEYSLTTSIKKLAVLEKPSIGLIQGYGAPSLSELQQVYQSLSILYSVENIDLNNEVEIASRFKAIALVAPKDSIPPSHFAKLDAYFNKGGKIMVAINRVNGDLQNAQGTELNTGLENWLLSKGIEVESSFLIDASCGSVTVQQRQGPFMMNTPISFPFLPLISNFAEHPITKGLEQIIMPFASPIWFRGDSSLNFTPLAYSSKQSGTMKPPLYFDIQRKWTAADLPSADLVVGGVLENGQTGGKLVVFGDGDFASAGQQGGQRSDNSSLMVNSIDWLSDDTGLIELRTKGVASRPIHSEYLGDENAGKRDFIKYLNFGLPVLLVIIYGLIRSTMQRNKRIRLMQERYA